MANVNLALDEIISKNRRPPQQQQRSAGKRPIRSNEADGFSRRIPPGLGGGGRAGRRFGREGNDDVVWINIANLPETVLTQDLQVNPFL